MPVDRVSAAEPKRSSRRIRSRCCNQFSWFAVWTLGAVIGLTSGLLIAAEPVATATPAPGEELLQDYFRLRTEAIEESCLANVKTAEDWLRQRDARHLELREMLRLSPWPEKTPLQPVITGTLEHGDIIVEKLHFQSQPGLYVTANLYRPREIQGKLPAILYVCGHANVKEKGVSLGNKAGYQHHGAWFAQNGYVCLTIDTIQLGEISGLHHGTHHLGMWEWLNRGYTPAGVEAWNGIRAIDYLQSRPEVDPERIGVTGRSGGGAYSWYIAALDDRVKAAAPVAGITSMRNHIIDKCINGHCDCMFMVNRYGWDFPLLAAMIAPRPMLLINTDRDRIFPLDGVVDVHTKTRRIYQLLNADENNGLFIAKGGHQDIQHLQNAAFQWFNLHLKKDTDPITTAATKLFTPRELKVFETLPADEKVTTAQEWFNLPSPQSEEQKLRQFKPSRIGLLTEHQLNVKEVKSLDSNGIQVRIFEFDSEQPYRLNFSVVSDVGTPANVPVNIHVLSPAEWDQSPVLGAIGQGKSDSQLPTEQLTSLYREGTLQVYLAPRGAGNTRWEEDPKAKPHTRRSFNLLGTTEDERRGIDTANALAAIQVALKNPTNVTVSGKGAAAFWSLYASLLSPDKLQYRLQGMEFEPRTAPQILGMEEQTSIPELLLQSASQGNAIEYLAVAGEDPTFRDTVEKKAKRHGVKAAKVTTAE